MGARSLTGLATPGHTNGCTSYMVPGAVFTGDTLFIHGNGRTDLQGGSAETLFDSVRNKLFALPDDTIVYPGHDYHGRVSSTIGEEKQFNERLEPVDQQGQLRRDHESQENPSSCKNGYCNPSQHASRQDGVSVTTLPCRRGSLLTRTNRPSEVARQHPNPIGAVSLSCAGRRVQRSFVV
ncbi:MAG: MBL fold metallo-hydrolase [Nitrospira sp.]